MKKSLIKIVAASGLVGAIGFAGIMSSSSLNAQESLNVPKYSLEGAEKVEFYLVNTPSGQEAVLNEEELKFFDGMSYSKITDYFVDRNKDGKTDLVHEETLVPAKYSPTKKDLDILVLYIDDGCSGSYDGYLDRVLIDQKDEKGNFGADGKFESEKRWLRLDGLKPKTQQKLYK